MNLEVKEQLDAILDIVKTIIPLKEAYLFGSFANGLQVKDSDFDLYFIVEDLDDDRLAKIIEIRGALFDVVTKPMDILLNTKATFDYRASNKSTLEYKIKKEGIKLYEK